MPKKYARLLAATIPTIVFALFFGYRVSQQIDWHSLQVDWRSLPIKDQAATGLSALLNNQAQSAPQSTGYALEGTVWNDLDGDGRREESETVAANTYVYLQAVVEPAGDEDALHSSSQNRESNQPSDYAVTNEDSDFDQILVVATNQNGYYKASGLGVGLYKVWVGDEAARENAQQVHVGEVDVVRSGLVNVAVSMRQLFLPIAGR